MIAVAGLAEVLARLRGAEVEAAMAATLEEQAAALAEAVRAGLGTLPGGEHSRPWQQSGALRASIGHQAGGSEAVVGSSDPAAAPQEMGTVRMAPRPFLGPVAAAAGPEIAEAAGAAVAVRLGAETLG